MSPDLSNATPIFIGGLYRSGTSLLRAMLSRHSNIAGGLETFWFDLSFTEQYLQEKNIRNWDATRNEPLKDHLGRLADFYDLKRSDVFSMAANYSSGEEFIDHFMAQYALLSGKRRWVEKTPANLLHIERIFAFWPKGYFIHVVRDPRDVFSSVRRSGKWTEPEVFSRLWIKFFSAYQKAKGTIPSGSIMEVRYEDLVCEPERTTRNILSFIDEPWEEGVANFQGESSDFEKVKTITGKSSATLAQLSKPLVKNRIGAWKNELKDSNALSELELIIQNNGFEQIWDRYKWV